MQIAAVGGKAGNPSTRQALPMSRSHNTFFAGTGACGSLVWMLAEGGFGNSFALGLCTSAWGQQERFAGALPTELLSMERGLRGAGL